MNEQELLAEELQGLQDSGYTPLMQAVRQRDQNQAERLLLEGAAVNVIGRKGLTALMLSVSKDNSDFTRLLLEFGADTSAADMRGKTALHHAVRAGDEITVTKLMEYGAYPNIVAHNGATPLIYTVLDRRWKIMGILLQWGAATEVPQGRYTCSALFTAIDSYDPSGTRLVAISALLDAGANPFLRSTKGLTALQQLRVRYEEILNATPPKSERTPECLRDWNKRQERFAQAIALLERAEEN